VSDGDAVTSGPGLRFFPNAPNPFNATTEIRFEMPVAGTYDLVVYDVAGRRVAGFGGIGAAGINTVHWDGRDAHGVDVGSGVYYCLVKAAGTSASSAMVLVK
jgi:hypothetical protein